MEGGGRLCAEATQWNNKAAQAARNFFMNGKELWLTAEFAQQIIAPPALASDASSPQSNA